MASKELQGERFVMLPFSVGCSSQSSIAVIENQPKKEQNYPNSMTENKACRKAKSSFLFLHLLRPNYSAGLHKLAKGFKMLCNSLFSIYSEDDEEDDTNMEIGYPTDVQHVAHIGWDGFNDLGGGTKGWEKALSSLSLKQLELAMVSQAQRGEA